MIIGISGKSQAGKDTIGNYLVEKHGFYRVASADALKRIARNIFGWDAIKDEKGRKFLQDLGCAVRGYNPTYWIDETLAVIKRQSNYGAKNFVITDVRFLNEAEIIKNAGGTIWRVQRNGIALLNHISETELDDYRGFDRVIPNDGTIEQLEEELGYLLVREPKLG